MRYSLDDDTFEVSTKVVDSLSPKAAESGGGGGGGAAVGGGTSGGASSVEHSFFEKEATYIENESSRRICTDASVALTVSEQVDDF